MILKFNARTLDYDGNRRSFDRAAATSKSDGGGNGLTFRQGDCEGVVKASPAPPLGKI
jgi:hypothetical protein